MRRFYIILGSSVALAFAIIVTVPWWFGGALKNFGPRYGVSFASYERVGYGRFALNDVRYQRPGVEVTSKRVELESALAWISHRLSGAHQPVIVGPWKLLITPTESAPSSPKKESGWVPLRETLQTVVDGLERWLPSTDTAAGEIIFARGSQRLTLSKASWRPRTLRVENLVYRAARADVEILWPAAGEAVVTLRSADETLKWDLVVRSERASLNATLHAWDQPANVSAQFADRGWLPQVAHVSANQWTLPAHIVKLSPAYDVVSGSATLNWQQERFDLELRADASPGQGKKAPAVRAIAQAAGDLNSISVNRLDLEAPGLQAHLSEPAVVAREGKLLSHASTFRIAADLAKQPWFTAQGQIEGQVVLSDGGNETVKLAGTLHGRELSGSGWRIQTADAATSLVWPKLEIASADLLLSEGHSLTVTGGWDFAARSLLASTVKGRIQRSDIASWVPDRITFRELSIDASASGEVGAISHQGTLEVQDLDSAPLKRSQLHATWRGKWLDLENFEVGLNAGASSANITGSKAGDSIVVSTFKISKAGAEQLTLVAPAKVHWQPSLSVERVDLEGPARKLSGAFTVGEQSNLEMASEGLDSDLISDFVALPGPAWQVSSFRATGSWKNGPVAFSTHLEGAIDLGSERKAEVVVEAQGDAKGMRFSDVRVSLNGAPILAAHGQLPLAFTAGKKTELMFDRTAPLDVKLATDTNEAFWTHLAEITGVVLENPRVNVDVSGSWTEPRGEAHVRIDRASLNPKSGSVEVPPIEGIEASLVSDGARLTLQSFSAAFAGQAVTANAEVPLPPRNDPAQWREPKTWLMSRLQGHLKP